MILLTCCVTGHRTIPAHQFEPVCHTLRQELSLAIQDGYTHFISGFAQGVDLLFAEMVLEEKKQNPSLTLEAVLPYQGRLMARDQNFQKLIKQCDQVTVYAKDYTQSCYLARNECMVNASRRVIAVYDGRMRGGTFFTINYARHMERDIRLIEVEKPYS